MNPKIDRKLKKIEAQIAANDLIDAQIALNTIRVDFPKNAKALKLAKQIENAYVKTLSDELKHAKSLNEKGDFQNLIPAAEAAFAKNPNDFEAAFLIGRGHEHVGDFEKAAEWMLKAVQIHPGYLIAHNDLGLLQHQQKNYLEAFGHLAKAVENSPDWNGPLCNLGMLLNNMGKSKEALMALDEAVKLDPTDPRALVNRGITHWSRGEKAEALRDQMAAIALAPRMVNPYSNLVEIYEKSNDGDGIYSALQMANEAGLADHPEIRMRWAEYYVRKKEYQSGIDSLKDVEVPADKEMVQQARHRLLSRCYDGVKDYPKAFEHYKLMNEVNQDSFFGRHSSADRYLNVVRAKYDAVKDLESFAWSDPFVPEKPEKLGFLVGFPRSGTTLLDTILLGHPDIEMAEEPPALEAMMKMCGWPVTLEQLDKLPNDKIPALRAEYLKRLRNFIGTTSTDSFLIDKMPLHLTNAAFVNRLFPEARFVFALRHPCDCTLSCFMQSFKLNDAMANFGTIERSAELYDAVMKLWREYRRLLPIEVFQNKYEDLVSDLRGCMEPMIEFYGLEWDENLLKYQESAGKREKISTPSYSQVVQPLYTTAAGRWRRYEPMMQDALPFLQEWREVYQYE